jgi:hypothetical protein
MKLKTLLLIFILYAPFANAVNLVCQAETSTSLMSYGSVDCSNGCEGRSDESFSIVFDSNNNKIIEVTDLQLYNGEDVYEEKITPSKVYFQLPHISGNRDYYMGVTIDRTSGVFYAYSEDLRNSYDGKCKVGKKLF